MSGTLSTPSDFAKPEDVLWTLYCATLVFFMHAGFSLLEAGYVQKKNQQSILIKNLMAISLGALGWMATGYGLAFGRDARNNDSTATEGGGFLGITNMWADEETLANYGHAGETDDAGVSMHGQMVGSRHAFYFFQYTFCATAATIVSGGVAERITLEAFSIVALVLTGVIYPVVAHWGWGDGILQYKGFNDFAGSGVVHMTGGFAALAGCIVIGPRAGRFGDEPLKPASMLLVSLGTLILWFGWFGFNAGSTTSMSGDNDIVSARCCVNTVLAASTGGITAFALGQILNGRSDLSVFCNGILAGLVGITAGCANIDPPVSLVIGMIAAVICHAATRLLEKLKIDDVVGAFPVHGACGAWGLVATGLFDMNRGVFYEAESNDCFDANLTGIFAIGSWAFGTTFTLFLILRLAGILRVDADVEEAGLDTEFVLHHQNVDNCAAGGDSKMGF